MNAVKSRHHCMLRPRRVLPVVRASGALGASEPVGDLGIMILEPFASMPPSYNLQSLGSITQWFVLTLIIRAYHYY